MTESSGPKSQTFGRYTVVGQLGRGAMGVVYLATDPMLNRQVAIKTVDLGVDDPSEREFLRDRLMRDARAAALLKHPNIVAIHDVFEEGGRAYVVMEYVEGESLAARLRVTPLPDSATVLNVLRQMAEALDYTHARGVVHRDIKPANVMIDGAGNAKIMDFGIARISDSRTCTPAGMVMGTVEYMSPEQIRGDAVDGRSDQFALAVVAYQMMTGSTLFGPNAMATLTYKIVNEAPPLPRTRNPALPAGVDAVLGKALAKSPSERFTTCCEFVGTLVQAFSGAAIAPVSAAPVSVAPVVANQPAEPTTHVSEPPIVAKPSQSKSLLVAIAAMLVLAGALGVAVWKPWERTQQPPAQAVVVKPATATPVPTTPVPVREPETPSQSKPPEAKTPAARPAEAKATTAVSTPPKVEPPPVATKAEKTATPEATEVAESLPPPPSPNAGANPTSFDAALKHGREQMTSKDYAGAIESYTKAIALRPDFAPAYLSRGVAHENLDQNVLALQDYTDTIRLAANMAPAYAARGVCLVRMHRDTEAWLDFRRALELKPDLPSALNGRGGIFFRRKQYREALADFDAAIASNPRFAQAYQNRARAREALGDLSGAAADRQREAELRRP